jgi:hypothetical protein
VHKRLPFDPLFMGRLLLQSRRLLLDPSTTIRSGMHRRMG